MAFAVTLRSVHTRRQVAATRHVAATNRFVCTRECFENHCLCNRILSQQHVAKNQIRQNFVRLVPATKFCCEDKDFHKISPVHSKRFVAAMCRRNMLWQLAIVAGSVHGLKHGVICRSRCNLSIVPPLPSLLGVLVQLVA